jgi:DNA-binding NarL/FixJ family response regulator
MRQSGGLMDAVTVVKDVPAAQLAEAIRKVLTGERVIDPTLASAAPAEGAHPSRTANEKSSEQRQTVPPAREKGWL